MSVFKELERLRIPFEDIKEATKDFTSIIGRGGYGPVYKGEVSLSGNLTSVAVKRLNLNYNQSGQGLKEFLTERQLLSRYKHENLVSLLGYCDEGNEKILIYERAEHGSFDQYLMKRACPLTWKQRMNICIDAARGLDYLHNHVAADHRVIHRDIKSGNILINQNWKAMIADLGLSKLGRANEKDTYIITNAGGTPGYCDPAYINDGVLTKESDVYSFGVVLFEALCGRLFFMNVPGEERLSVPLVRRYYEEGKLDLIMDLDLKNSESVKEFSAIAYQCLHDHQKGRPSMDLVLQKLEKALQLLESEEAFLQKLEETLGLQKLVETLQEQEVLEALILQEIEEALEEALELDKLEETLGLQKLVDTLQEHEVLEAFILQEIEEALEEASELDVLQDKKEKNKQQTNNASSVIVVDLEMNLHCLCNGCAPKIIKEICNLEGVEYVGIESNELKKLTVSGTFDPVKLEKEVKEKYKKKTVKLIIPGTKATNNGKDWYMRPVGRKVKRRCNWWNSCWK